MFEFYLLILLKYIFCEDIAQPTEDLNAWYSGSCNNNFILCVYSVCHSLCFQKLCTV